MLSLTFGTFILHNSARAAAQPNVTLPNSAARWISSAHLAGHHKRNDQMTIGLLLKTMSLDQQKALVASLYHPRSFSYHRWLSSAKFYQHYAPSQSSIAAAQAFLTQSGLHLVASPDASLQLASGTTSQVEAAFHTTINDYSLAHGKTYYGNTSNVQLPLSLSPSVLGVFGLSNVRVARSYDRIDTSTNPNAPPPPYGGGPFGSGLTPSQIAGIYDANRVYQQLKNQGQGTTLAVYELAGYTSSDITFYENHYHLPHVKLVNKPVLGGATTHDGAAEVELDIELQIAMAPGMKQLLVYLAPNTELGALSEYLQIAKDNQADSISSSWGIPCEFFVNSQITLAENQIFLQMAAQGQSVFAASGDSGAYGCSRVGILPPAGQELQIGDPDNQPYITAVGATSFQGPDNITTFDPGQNEHPTYPGSKLELPWTDGCDPQTCNGGATGGGVSRIWAEPDYATNLTTGQYFPGAIGSYSQAGSYCGQQPGVVCRENPDVSLDGDPSTGYSIYCTDPGDSFCKVGEFTPKPGWIRLGGTSTSAPLWAGIAALDITLHKHARLGLFNYIVYPFDSRAGYASQFHDIISKFSNGSGGKVGKQVVPPGYTANAAYDLETGVGTPDIFNFITA
jgi:subtilase family serine protease